MKFRSILVSLPLLVGACCISSANASSSMNIPKLKINVNSALKTYIVTSKGSSMGKNMELDYKYCADYSTGWQIFLSSQNLNNLTFEKALSNLDNSISKILMYNGLKNIKFKVALDTPQKSIACDADFDHLTQYNTITLNLSLDQSAAGHCDIQVETT